MAVENLLSDNALICGENTNWGGGTTCNKLLLSSPEILSQIFTLVSHEAVISKALSGENLHPTMFDKWPTNFKEGCIRPIKVGNQNIIHFIIRQNQVLSKNYNIYLEFWVSTPCPWEEVPYHRWICICQFQRLPPFFHQENNHSTIMAGYEIYFGPYCIHTSHNPTPEKNRFLLQTGSGGLY